MVKDRVLWFRIVFMVAPRIGCLVAKDRSCGQGLGLVAMNLFLVAKDWVWWPSNDLVAFA